MRTLILIPVALAVVMAVGFGLCSAMERDPHAQQMTIAAGICFVAAFAGALPLWFVRSASQYAVSQAALIGTMTHMFVAVAGAAVIALGKIAGGLTPPLLYWLMACFMAALVVLVIAYIRALRSARVEATTKTAPDVERSSRI